MTTETKPDLYELQEACQTFEIALGRATDNGTFDMLAADIHPDKINGMCDTVKEICDLELGKLGEPRTPHEITIDVTTHANSARLYARIVWEHLFRFVHGERFHNLDHFLIDLADFAELLPKGEDLYWYFEPENGVTSIGKYHNKYVHCYLLRLYDTDNGRRYILIKELPPQSLEYDNEHEAG